MKTTQVSSDLSSTNMTSPADSLSFDGASPITFDLTGSDNLTVSKETSPLAVLNFNPSPSTVSSEAPTVPVSPAATGQVDFPAIQTLPSPLKTEGKLLQNTGESVDDPFHDMGMTKTGSSALGEMLTSSKVGGFLPKASLFLDPNPSRFRVGLPTNFLTSTGQVNFPTSNTVINVNYTGFTPAAQTAFQFAVDIWESLLDSSVPINVNASFANLGSGILGQAGPEDFFINFSGAPQTNTWYPIALANSLAGQDLDPTASDIGSQFNSNFNWYYGLDNNVPTNQISFVSVVLHELGHGLGFLGLMDNQSGVGSWGFGTGFPGIYDRFTENGSGQSLLNTSLFPNPSTALGSQLTSNNIFFDGSNANAANGGNRVKLYAPSTWSGGSSYSHLDEVFNNTPNALMTYSIGSGESILNPGPVTLGLFKDMGWKLAGSSTNPTLAIAATNADQTEGNSGSKAFTFTVTRAVNTTGANNVNWAVTGSGTSAANATDFVGGVLPSGTVSFAAGETSKVITVNVQGDTTVEPNENFTVTLSNPTNGATITTATAVGTIQNDDGNTGNTFTNSTPISIPQGGPSTPYPSTINVSGLSGNINSLKVTLTNLSHTWPDDIDVLLVGPTGTKALLMSDVGGFNSLSNVTLTFDPTATSLLPDEGIITSGSYKATDFETGDFFNAPAPGGPYGTDFSVFNGINPNGTWSLYVIDDAGGDAGTIAGGWSLNIGTASTAPTLAIAATNANQTEGNSGSKAFTFTVTRAVNTTGANNVNWAVTGSGTSAANATDFVGGVLPSGTVSFAAGETSKVITVNVQGDTTVEPNENFTVTLSNPTNGATITTATAVGTIQNDDNPPTITLDADGNGVAQGATDGILVARYLFGFTGTTLTNGAIGSGATRTTATDIQNYLQNGLTTMLDADGNGVAQGATDGILIARYLFGFTGTTLTNGAIGTGATRTTATQIQSFLATYLPTSSGSKVATTLPTQNITATPSSSTVVPGGAVSVKANYSTSDNNTTLPSSFGFKLHYSSSNLNFVNFANPGVFSTGVTPTIGTPEADTLNEDNDTTTNQVINVAWLNFSGVPWPNMAFPVTLYNANFTAASTFTTGTTKVNFSSQNTAPGYTFQGTSAVITAGTTTVPTLAIAATNANQTEGNSGSKAFTFTVTRAVNTTGANNVNWAVTGSGTSAANATDFVGGVLPSGTVSFAAGETSKVITVNVQGDTTVEPNENFTVTLSNPTNGATITTATAVGTIQNDDEGTSVTLASNYSGVSENGKTNLVYNFTRSGATTNSLTVNFTLGGTATRGNDYNAYGGNFVSPTTGNIVFASGQTTAQIEIVTTGDTVKEANETIAFTLASGTGYTIGTPGAVTTTILNDDGVLNQQGTTGNDVIEAGTTRNLSGRAGHDILIGSNASDMLVGAAGNDTITSGAGFDVIAYSLASEGQDTITDFNVFQDTLQVSAAGFGGGLIAGESIAAAQFVLGTVATTASHRFIFNKPTGQLFFDVDGNGSSVQTLLATLTPNLNLTEDNIFAA
jgi:ribosomal protein L28